MFRKLKKKNRSRHHTLNKKTNIDAVALWSKSISDDKELSETGFFTIFEVALAEGFSGSPPLGAAPASGHALLPPVSTLARTVLSHGMSSPLSTLSPWSCQLIYINLVREWNNETITTLTLSTNSGNGARSRPLRIRVMV